MEVNSLIPDLVFDYVDQSEKETITITGNLEVKSVEKGTGYVIFMTEPKQLAPTDIAVLIEGPSPTDYSQTEIEGISRTVQVTLPERFACTGFIDEGVSEIRGALRAPALRIERKHGDPIVIFLFRSSTSPHRWLPEKHELSVTHKSGTLTATLREDEEGGIEAQVNMVGTEYKRGAMVVKRFIDLPKHPSFSQFSGTTALPSDGQVVGTPSEGSATLSWSPINPEFDFISAFSSRIDWKSARELLLPFGIDVGDLHKWTLPTLQFYCDGPGINYIMTLVGWRSLLYDEDTTKLWVVPRV